MGVWKSPIPSDTPGQHPGDAAGETGLVLRDAIMEAKLIVSPASMRERKYRSRGRNVLIGRGEECQLRLQSNMVSRRHCLLRFDRFPATLEDCGSTNGTLLNGQPVAGRRN